MHRSKLRKVFKRGKRPYLFVFISVFVLAGVLVIVLIRAAASQASLEVEQGSLGGTANIGSDSNASGGSFVQFVSQNSGQVMAFPGAEGFGATTPGGRGGKVYEVTNLNDTGTGSLRACAEASGPRICVFRIGGMITLSQQINIKNPNITIAGQTAPGGGITLKTAQEYLKATLKIVTHDVVIRGIRFRPGPSSVISTERRAVDVEDGAHHIIFDHCSLSWATDETLTIIDGVRDMTVQWSIISEALSHSTHGEGEHSKAILISGKKYNSTLETANVTFHHNIMAHNNDRNPRNTSYGLVDIVNNVVYNWGIMGSEVNSSNASPVVNVVGNFYKKGADISQHYELTGDATSGLPVGIFVKGNIGPHRTDDTQPETNIIRPADRIWVVPNRYTAPTVTTTSAFTAYDQVLAKAGVRVPFFDPVDNRIVNDIRNSTGRIIDDPSQVGGWPILAAGTAPTDSDHDGMPDTWETARGLNPNSDDSAGDRDHDGYTNIEEYINSLMFNYM